MRPPETERVRLAEPFDMGADDGAFHALSYRTPFPSSGGGFARSGRGPRIEVELESGPAAAAEARAAIEALAGEADPELLDDVRLLVSEVVTNAVRHSDSPRGATIGLAVEILGDAVRAEVTDAGRGFEPAPRARPRTDVGGWGLHLVDRLADRWGVDRGRRALVWFEVA